MNLTIRQFRAFLAVADLRSFTAASKYLCITQGAVSGLINEMESQMEVSLFDRTSRVVKLSPDGEKFLPAAMRVVEEFQRAENYARDLFAHASAAAQYEPLFPCVARTNARHSAL